MKNEAVQNKTIADNSHNVEPPPRRKKVVLCHSYILYLYMTIFMMSDIHSEGIRVHYRP